MSLNKEVVAERVAHGACLQIHSDGGYDGERGAAAILVVCYSLDSKAWEPEAVGYKGLFMETARSALMTCCCFCRTSTSGSLQYNAQSDDDEHI